MKDRLGKNTSTRMHTCERQDSLLLKLYRNVSKNYKQLEKKTKEKHARCLLDAILMVTREIEWMLPLSERLR